MIQVKDYSYLINEIVIAGKYEDNNGNIFIFDKKGNLTFKGKNYFYKISLRFAHRNDTFLYF